VILELELNGQKHRADVVQRNGRFHLKLDGGKEQVLEANFSEPGTVQFSFAGRSYEFRYSTSTEGELSFDHRGRKLSVAVRDPRALRSRRAGAAGEAGPVKITAPMPGKVVRIVAPAGSEVEAGVGVVVIEAMKMQNELKSPKAGKVQKIAVEEGATVNPGDTLTVIE
jgi:biotin carboxyl carrier protein